MFVREVRTTIIALDQKSPSSASTTHDLNSLHAACAVDPFVLSPKGHASHVAWRLPPDPNESVMQALMTPPAAPYPGKIPASSQERMLNVLLVGPWMRGIVRLSLVIKNVFVIKSSQLAYTLYAINLRVHEIAPSVAVVVPAGHAMQVAASWTSLESSMYVPCSQRIRAGLSPENPSCNESASNDVASDAIGQQIQRAAFIVRAPCASGGLATHPSFGRAAIQPVQNLHENLQDMCWGS